MQRTRIIGWIALGMVGIVLAVYLAGSILIPPAQEHPFFIYPDLLMELLAR